MATMTWRCVTALAGLLACAGMALGYPVGPAVSLEKLTEEADIIFKGTAVSSKPVQDNWFRPCQDFVARQTQFKIVSVIKGDRLGGSLVFRHYDYDPEARAHMFQPLYYYFEPGRTYIVFAKKGGPAGVFRQLWMNHTMKEDQGVVLCANDKPIAAKTVKEALWAELTAMLGSADVSDVIYAIRQLDEMSGSQGVFECLSDFDRKDVLAAVRGLMSNRDPKIAQAAIGLIGSHNPYMSDERTIHWLATVGSAEAPGVGRMDPKTKNVGGELYWKDLVEAADGKASDDTRAMAILALGLVREPALDKPIARWLADPSLAVRASAALLLADFPGPETCKRLTALAGDAAPEVRACAARAAGFGQQAAMAEILAKLLTDKERKVREAAAKSLLSFSPKNEAFAAIFRANLENQEFNPLFLNALAREDPAGHLDALAKAVEQKAEPRNFWGGQTPACTSRVILFKYLRAQPADEIRGGKFDRYLGVLEKAAPDSREIYAFYLQRGMTERAKKFRAEAKKTATYDIDRYFNQVDENPSLYNGE